MAVADAGRRIEGASDGAVPGAYQPLTPCLFNSINRMAASSRW